MVQDANTSSDVTFVMSEGMEHVLAQLTELSDKAGLGAQRRIEIDAEFDTLNDQLKALNLTYRNTKDALTCKVKAIPRPHEAAKEVAELRELCAQLALVDGKRQRCQGQISCLLKELDSLSDGHFEKTYADLVTALKDIVSGKAGPVFVEKEVKESYW